MAELDEVVSTYREFKDCEKQLEETKDLAKDSGGDEDMAEMIAFEISALTNQLEKLEDKSKVLLLPSDPLDARNIFLEGTGGDEAGLWAGDLVAGAANHQRRRQELTQTTPDQPLDDEAVYNKVASDCPK
ncbi:hypothetical protein Syun_017131 [Stephania yunnanensis]|uniref:Peptide chain release factor domain-containing protein n=1 Tax=Stephania yunnanensis TaxID=152371 RepID=A0AAP0P326_9MAGN